MKRFEKEWTESVQLAVRILRAVVNPGYLIPARLRNRCRFEETTALDIRATPRLAKVSRPNYRAR